MKIDSASDSSISSLIARPVSGLCVGIDGFSVSRA